MEGLREKIKRFKELWERGLKSDEIARELGILENMVPTYAIAAGLIPKSMLKNVWNRKVTPQVLVYMRDMFLEGATITEIAECFGIDVRTVQKHLNSIGLKRRRVAKTKEKITVDKLKELSEKGYTDAAIAEHFGVGRQYIAGLRIRYGIYKKGPRGLGHVKYLEKIADMVMEEIDRKCYTTSRELRERGVVLNRQLLLELEDFIEGLQWFRVSQTSTQKYTVFPARINGTIIIYVEGCEKEVTEFLRGLSYPVPSKTLKNLLKNWAVPEKLLKYI